MEFIRSAAFTVAAGSMNDSVFVIALSIGIGGVPWQMSAMPQPFVVFVLLKIG